MSENFYQKLFARYYDRFMDRTEKVILRKRRKRLLSPLRGNILEIGSGTGVNFPLYGEDAHVIAAEPSQAMMDRALHYKSRSGDGWKSRITPLVGGIGDRHLEETVAPGSMDVVVCTLVLCTVPDLDQAVAFIKSRLKPGGKLILLEHVVSETGGLRFIQNSLNPFWKKFSLGCNLNRDPERAVKAHGFKLLEEEHFRKSFPFYQGVFTLPA